MADYKNILDFIRQVYQTENFVPLSVPKFIGNEKAYLNECIDTTFVSSVGKFVDRFEEDMARYTGAKKAVVCVSGTNALHMAMVLVGVERDDEVLTQALTFIATCNAISYIGAHPVFIDVDRSTMGLSPDALLKWLSENAEVRMVSASTKLPVAESNVACLCIPSVILFALRKLWRFATSITSSWWKMLQRVSEVTTKANIPVHSVR